MQKQAPSPARIAAMLLFALSCFGLLLFLWLSFGGPVPLKPEGYRLKASFAEAATLPVEADVRMAGVRVGKVKRKELQEAAARTLVEIEIESRFAPIPSDSRAILRQKTLLGETYLEITPGSRAAATLPDGGTLARVRIEPTVELDEIFQAFDRRTQDALRAWVRESARGIEGGTGEALNDAIGNLPRFAGDGAEVLGVLDRHEAALRRLVRDTGDVFGALTERQGQLRELIGNAGDVFEATSSRDEALAEAFAIFPTFLDESRATLGRLEGFSRNAEPLARDLGPVADDLGPAVRDLGDLAPDLEGLFRDLDPLIAASRSGLPDAARFVREAEPTLEALHPFLEELNPILSFANYEQDVLASFVGNGGLALPGTNTGGAEGRRPGHYLRQFTGISDRTLSIYLQRQPWDRGNAYPAPNYLTRAFPLGIPESFDCTPAGGEVRDASEDNPPCFEAPASLFSGTRYPFLRRGEAPRVPAPGLFEGTEPAAP